MTADAQQTGPAIDFDEHFGTLDDAVEHLRQMVLARQEADRHVTEAEQAVLAMVEGAVKAGGTVEDPVMKHVLHHLHYRVRFFPSAELAKAAGFVTKNGAAYTQGMARKLGPGTTDEPCTRCGGTIFTFSGSGWAYRSMCQDCNKDIEREEREQREEQRRPRSQRWDHERSGKVSAPVADWRVAIALVLAYPPAITSRGDQEGDWTWSKFEQARSVEQRLAPLLPEDTAEVGIEAAAQLVASAQKAADWHPGRACSITEHLTNLNPTAVLAHLNTATTRRRRELEAEALELYPDLPGATANLPHQAQ